MDGHSWTRQAWKKPALLLGLVQQKNPIQVQSNSSGRSLTVLICQTARKRYLGEQKVSPEKRREDLGPLSAPKERWPVHISKFLSIGLIKDIVSSNISCPALLGSSGNYFLSQSSLILECNKHSTCLGRLTR